MAENNIALTEAVYYILLSLYVPMHGYGIMQNVEKLSNGRVHLAAGTLYGAINTMLEKKWIVLYGESETTRKKEYLITALGKEKVTNELVRLEELVKNGRTVIGGKSDV